jgi:hypothetical protein
MFLKKKNFFFFFFNFQKTENKISDPYFDEVNQLKEKIYNVCNFFFLIFFLFFFLFYFFLFLNSKEINLHNTYSIDYKNLLTEKSFYNNQKEKFNKISEILSKENTKLEETYKRICKITTELLNNLKKSKELENQFDNKKK